MSDYIKDLNEGQRAAVSYDDGPSLVIAGAGSGKTRVLTYKIAWLLEHGYEPWSILALTFTNKAAREMKDRISTLVGPARARRLWMGTFHSILSRILRAEAQHTGFSSNFTIYDTSDSKSLLRSIIKEMMLDEKVYKPGVVQSHISKAKNRLITPSAYATSKDVYEADMAIRMPAIRDIYRHYWERCRQSDAMDFDDLLLHAYMLFREHADVLSKYQELFRYVLVDEYQDTNYAQHCIVLQLAQRHRHVCVVGDDAQSIYSFRGADIDNILHFTRAYPEAKLFKLEQNYRSTQTIVCAANCLIAKNERQIRKEVFSEKEKGDAIDVSQAYSDIEEGEIVLNKIAMLRRHKDYMWADFAILYRTNAQSRVFEEALRKRNIPYRVYGGMSFYQRKEIKDVIAYFRMVVNQNDEEAFKRIINYPARGIGNTTLGKISVAAMQNGVSLWTVLCRPSAYGLNFNKGVIAKLQSFRKLIENLTEIAAAKNAYEAGSEIIRHSGIIADVCQDTSPENISRKENIEELINGMSSFCAMRLEEGNNRVSLADFLSEVSLLTDQDSDNEGGDDKVTLMTVHSAKGLEFKNVFVVGMEENLFPSNMSGESVRALEEERRLFYVAITRAEEHCFLSYAKTRIRYGKMEFGAPSRFLKDIDARFLHLPQDIFLSQRIEENAASFRHEWKNSFSPSSPNLKRITPNMPSTPVVSPHAEKATSEQDTSRAVHPGQYIVHERFGRGEVVSVDGDGDNAKALIRFDNAGEKQLLLRFARFRVVE